MMNAIEVLLKHEKEPNQAAKLRKLCANAGQREGKTRPEVGKGY